MAGRRSIFIGYVAAGLMPIAVTYLVAWLQWPPFVFEHLVVLLVLGVAIPWGLGPASLAAVTAVASDNVLLREPVGQPTITGYRDIFDLALFIIVAIVVSGLMRRAHLSRRVAEEAAARERAAREDRERLVATVTHDLATPLSVLTHTVQFARRRGPSPDVDWGRLLDRLEIASQRATSLVRTLSDVQALDAADFALNCAPHDLRALVTRVTKMLDRTSDRHPIVVNVPETPIIVWADGERFQRVLENLLTNAVKYSPRGGTIEVTLAQEQGRASLTVRDHGIGISPDALPHIFERSYRAPEAAFAPGLGLGLSIAAEVIRRHDGTLSAAPAPGGGMMMTVRLPLAPRMAGAAIA